MPNGLIYNFRHLSLCQPGLGVEPFNACDHPKCSDDSRKQKATQSIKSDARNCTASQCSIGPWPLGRIMPSALTAAELGIL